MQKIICFFLAVLFAGSSLTVAAAEKFQAVLEPSTVMEGENFMLQLSSDGNEQPELLEVPAGFTYQGSSQSTRIVNGKRSNTVGYQFAAPPAGTHKIPPLKVRVGREQFKTPELVLNVVKDNTAGLGAEDVFAKAEIGKKAEKFYVGEYIPLSVNVYYPQKIRLQLAYPVLDIGKSIFRDFRKSNPENPSFAPVRRGRKVNDDKLFEEVRFMTSFRPLAPGKLTVRGKVNCNILIPEKRRSRDPFDDFWGGGINYRRIARELKISSDELTILPLPPQPENGFFLGLVGQYQARAELSAGSVNALEPVSLDITLRSENSFESLTVPELALKDCRVYPGEVRYTEGGCVVSYAIIPLKEGMQKIKCDFFYFDPVSGKYKNIAIDRSLEVKPAVGKSTAVAPASLMTPAAASTAAKESVELPPVPRTTLLYCKKSPSGAVYNFYRRNRIELALLLFIAGPLVWLLSVLVRKIRRNSEDLAEKRREKAGTLRNILAEKLRNAPVDDLPLLATGEVADFLSDRWKLPAGATPEDVANAAEDEKLSEVLRECSNISYLPKELVKNALSDPEYVRKQLLNALKITVVFVSVMIVPSVDGKDAAVPATWKDALHAYDQGKYTAAKNYFEKYQQENGNDPNVFYNLGCIAEANGEPEMALWYLECAGLLSPHDSAIFENRNVMRSKFFLPSAHTLDTPQKALLMVRDQLHPQDYLVLAALCWFAFFVLLSLQKKLPAGVVWGSGAGLLAAMLLFLSVMTVQYNSVYRANHALVVTRNAEVFTFPGVHNGKQVGSLSGGTPVDIIEEQTDYSLVRAGNIEGWTANKNIRKLLSE